MALPTGQEGGSGQPCCQLQPSHGGLGWLKQKALCPTAMGVSQRIVPSLQGAGVSSTLWMVGEEQQPSCVVLPETRTGKEPLL